MRHFGAGRVGGTHGRQSRSVHSPCLSCPGDLPHRQEWPVNGRPILVTTLQYHD
jgi:hypothetical protein